MKRLPRLQPFPYYNTYLNFDVCREPQANIIETITYILIYHIIYTLLHIIKYISIYNIFIYNII